MNAATHIGGNVGIERAVVPLEIEQADADSDGRLRIRGYANTFGVMRSGRIIHPQAVEDWLRANPKARPQLLANHGLDVGGFATIGKVDSLKVDRQRGLLFQAWVAHGTRLADEARTLIQQGALDSLSIGWTGKQARWVRANDQDVDPWLAEKMREAGVDQVYAHLAIADLVELSVVDVPDDPAARMAARAADAAAIEAAVKPLRDELEGLRAEVRRLNTAGASVDVAAITAGLDDVFQDFVERFKDAALDALASDPDLVESATLLQENIAALPHARSPRREGGDDDLAELQRRVAAGPGRRGRR